MESNKDHRGTSRKEKFAEGGFQSAYKCTSNEGKMLVLKKYHPETKETITGVFDSTVEVHARKQVQMHAVSNYITNVFSKKIPSEFGRSFTFNTAYYAQFENEPVTIEEFVPGKFTKYVNNDGSCVQPTFIICNSYKLYYKVCCIFLILAHIVKNVTVREVFI